MTVVGWSVREAGPSDLDAIVATLSAAFRDDPVMRWAFSHRRGRDRKIRAFFSLMAGEVFLPRARVLVTTNVQGVACWVPPGGWPITPVNAEAFARESRALFGARAGVLARGESVTEAYHPTEPHFYLWGAGVNPSMQSRGIGSSLIRPVLDECDSSGVGAYLEASTIRNVTLYERLGFAVRREIELPKGPSLFLMWRAPRIG
jgi:ribosomal protein S18 acetylase RimI-like enzyme